IFSRPWKIPQVGPCSLFNGMYPFSKDRSGHTLFYEPVPGFRIYPTQLKTLGKVQLDRNDGKEEKGFQ
ncbi:MAG: hypothetical protein KC592_04395, partial [Nitrospira sp.]|nr:hypothetical protein [Nitrospira sp.]